MTFELTILGSNSATPTFDRHPTAQLLNIRDRYYLLDCGEGTQMQLIKYRIKYHKISHIFISHLHGDHYFGLMGLLSTMHLQGRTNELHIYGHPELMDIIELQLRLSQTILRFGLIFHPFKHFTGAVIHEDDNVLVRSVVLNHRIPCNGFVFIEKKLPRKILMDKIHEYQIPVSSLNNIKKGKDYVGESGKVIPNDELTIASADPRSYAFISDTKYDEYLVEEIKNVDLLYHEATFMHELKDRASTTFHSTALQAAMIAQKAGVIKLLIGHFSARYRDLNPLLEEAKTKFTNTELAIEGTTFKIPSKGIR
jgi:ribonuclease Z